MTTEERRRRRFSAAFRKEQVRLIESGKVSVHEVSKLYEVKVQNVKNWVKKFGSKELPKTIIITNSTDYNRLRDLEKQIKELNQIIGEQQVKLLIQEKLLSKAKEQLGADFEKK